MAAFLCGSAHHLGAHPCAPSGERRCGRSTTSALGLRLSSRPIFVPARTGMGAAPVAGHLADGFPRACGSARVQCRARWACSFHSMEDVDPAWLEPTWFLDAESAGESRRIRRGGGRRRRPTPPRWRSSCSTPCAMGSGTTRTEPTERPRATGQVLICSSRDGLVCAEVGVADRCGPQSRYPGPARVRRREEPPHVGEAAGVDGHRRLRLARLQRTAPSAAGGSSSARRSTSSCVSSFGTRALEFDGTVDALMHPFDESGNRHMEYVKQRGSFDDLPLDAIFASLRRDLPEPWGSRAPAPRQRVTERSAPPIVSSGRLEPFTRLRRSHGCRPAADLRCRCVERRSVYDEGFAAVVINFFGS